MLLEKVLKMAIEIGQKINSLKFIRQNRNFIPVLFFYLIFFCINLYALDEFSYFEKFGWIEKQDKEIFDILKSNSNCLEKINLLKEKNQNHNSWIYGKIADLYYEANDIENANLHNYAAAISAFPNSEATFYFYINKITDFTPLKGTPKSERFVFIKDYAEFYYAIKFGLELMEKKQNTLLLEHFFMHVVNQQYMEDIEYKRYRRSNLHNVFFGNYHIQKYFKVFFSNIVMFDIKYPTDYLTNYVGGNIIIEDYYINDFEIQQKLFIRFLTEISQLRFNKKYINDNLIKEIILYNFSVNIFNYQKIEFLDSRLFELNYNMKMFLDKLAETTTVFKNNNNNLEKENVTKSIEAFLSRLNFLSIQNTKERDYIINLDEIITKIRDNLYD